MKCKAYSKCFKNNQIFILLDGIQLGTTRNFHIGKEYFVHIFNQITPITCPVTAFCINLSFFFRIIPYCFPLPPVVSLFSRAPFALNSSID